MTDLLTDPYLDELRAMDAQLAGLLDDAIATATATRDALDTALNLFTPAPAGPSRDVPEAPPLGRAGAGAYSEFPA